MTKESKIINGISEKMYDIELDDELFGRGILSVNQ